MSNTARQLPNDPGSNQSNTVDVGSTAAKLREGSIVSRINNFPLIEAVFLIAAASYAVVFFHGLSPYWFHPDWTTDDALQQLYPFHKVANPDLYKGDLITLMMESYLAPAHYWLTYAATWLCGDPIMAGHWVMLLQVLLSVGFLFGAVLYSAGFAPACFAAAWLIHTRHIMQRMTGGLPRGWAAPVIAAFFFFALRGNHTGVLFTILIGCILHPPATLAIAAAYGLFLLLRVADKRTRPLFTKHLLRFILLGPVFVISTLSVVNMPEQIGTMASYETAAQMPEFSYPHGRFPFVPLRDAESEIRAYGFQAFVGRFYSPPRIIKRYIAEITAGIFILLLCVGWLRRRRVLPAELICFLIAALGVYFASREFAFKLYVPNRHLQFPMAFFIICSISIAAWRAFASHPIKALDKISDQSQINSYPILQKFSKCWGSCLALIAIGALVYSGSGTGLYGAANFNYSRDKKGGVFRWLAANTPQDALIAGEPTHIDGVQLFAARQAFATTETAHPFYDRYYQEIKRRMIVSLRAHYAATLEEFVELLEPEGVDYFIFKRRNFYPEALESVSYFLPLDALVKELTARPVDQYAFRELPRQVDLTAFPAMPFRDEESVVVDLKLLRDYLVSSGRLAG